MWFAGRTVAGREEWGAMMELFKVKQFDSWSSETHRLDVGVQLVVSNLQYHCLVHAIVESVRHYGAKTCG